MNCCSPARPCQCAKLPLPEHRRRGPAAMICHTSIPAAWLFVGTAGPRSPRPGAQRDRQNRPCDHAHRHRAATAARTDATPGPQFCRRQPQPQRAHGCALWPLARRMARCVAERYRARDAHAARGISAGPHCVHGDGSLAHLARPRPNPACDGNRDAGCRYDVLGTDKTGTLTQNRMTIVALRAGRTNRAEDDKGQFDGKFAALLEYGILASARQPFDPMEKVFHALGTGRLPRNYPSRSGRTLKWEDGLRPDLLAVTHVYEQARCPELIVAAKGAPEAIAELCRLPERDRRSYATPLMKWRSKACVCSPLRAHPYRR